MASVVYDVWNMAKKFNGSLNVCSKKGILVMYFKH